MLFRSSEGVNRGDRGAYGINFLVLAASGCRCGLSHLPAVSRTNHVHLVAHQPIDNGHCMVYMSTDCSKSTLITADLHLRYQKRYQAAVASTLDSLNTNNLHSSSESHQSSAALINCQLPGDLDLDLTLCEIPLADPVNGLPTGRLGTRRGALAYALFKRLLIL